MNSLIMKHLMLVVRLFIFTIYIYHFLSNFELVSKIVLQFSAGCSFMLFN